jgi:hypothetical protein
MARDAENEAGYEAFPSPQWVKDRAVGLTVCNPHPYKSSLQ